MKRSTSRFACLSLLLLPYCAFAGDWPQWRGPNRDGISQETGLLKQWPAEGPKLLWENKDIGSGYSTPSVVDDRLFVLSNRGNDNEFVLALNTSDGQQVWSQRIGNVGNPNQQPSYPAARSTPTVVGDVLYALGSDGDLVCLETSTGNSRWTKSLRKDFGGKPGQWAYAESPLVDGDALVFAPGGSTATIVALNRNSGDVIWKCAIPGGEAAAYASTIIVDADGVKQYVSFLAKSLVGVDAKTGKLLWRYEQTAKGSPAVIPTPVAQGAQVYSGGARAGGGLVKLLAEQGKVTAKQVYFDPKLPTAIGGSVLVADHLYGTSMVLLCSDFNTGKVMWTDRSIGPSSLCCADGNLYLHGENGDVALVEATPEAYREKGRFTPPNPPDRGESKAWAYPVIANGRLYIRDMSSLWSYDIKAR